MTQDELKSIRIIAVNTNSKSFIMNNKIMRNPMTPAEFCKDEKYAYMEHNGYTIIQRVVAYEPGEAEAAESKYLDEFANALVINIKSTDSPEEAERKSLKAHKKWKKKNSKLYA